jgi:(E)-2-((N-methylformamido)methylene)succinate hydrolase
VTTPTLVLLHGVGLDHTMWEPVVALLTDEVEVVTPDLPGHGTRAPAPPGVTLADLADGVAAEIPPGSHLVGFSLGALVGQHLARYRPQLVSTLTSVSSVCRRTPEEREAVLARLRMAENDFPASVAASLRRWYDGTDVDAEQVQRAKVTLLANDPDSFVNCYRVFATADAEIGPELDRITVPALAVTGEHDPGSTPEMTRRLAEAMPNCRAVIVPRARHMLPVERPTELVDCLSTFIGEYAHV